MTSTKISSLFHSFFSEIYSLRAFLEEPKTSPWLWLQKNSEKKMRSGLGQNFGLKKRSSSKVTDDHYADFLQSIELEPIARH